jgi:hypothetical protein
MAQRAIDIRGLSKDKSLSAMSAGGYDDRRGSRPSTAEVRDVTRFGTRLRAIWTDLLTRGCRAHRVKMLSISLPTRSWTG